MKLINSDVAPYKCEEWTFAGRARGYAWDGIQAAAKYHGVVPLVHREIGDPVWDNVMDQSVGFIFNTLEHELGEM